MNDADLEELGRSLESAALRVAPPSAERAVAAAARGRRRRIVRRAGGAVVAAALVAGVTVPLVLLLPLRDEREPQPPATTPTPTAPSASATATASPEGSPLVWPSEIEPEDGLMEVFTPPTFMEGDLVIMPVTFPDGTTAQLAYPPDLDLAGEGMRPNAAGSVPGAPRDFWIFHGRVEDVLALLGGATLLEEYSDGLGSTVGFWDLWEDRDTHYLAFQFGSWSVLVYDYTGKRVGAPMSEEARGQWAGSLRGHETDTGFLVLESVPPLDLAGAGVGPELQFGDLNPRFVLLFPGPCEEYRAGEGGFDEDDLVEVDGIVMSRSDDFASWCDPGGLMSVHVYQAPGDDYIDRIALGLEVREVRLATG